MTGLAGDKIVWGKPRSDIPWRNGGGDPVIAGASSLEQLIHNTAARDAPALSNEEIERIRSFSRANQYTAHR